MEELLVFYFKCFYMKESVGVSKLIIYMGRARSLE